MCNYFYFPLPKPFFYVFSKFLYIVVRFFTVFYFRRLFTKVRGHLTFLDIWYLKTWCLSVLYFSLTLFFKYTCLPFIILILMFLMFLRDLSKRLTILSKRDYLPVVNNITYYCFIAMFPFGTLHDNLTSQFSPFYFLFNSFIYYLLSILYIPIPYVEHLVIVKISLLIRIIFHLYKFLYYLLINSFEMVLFRH